MHSLIAVSVELSSDSLHAKTCNSLLTPVETVENECKELPSETPSITQALHHCQYSPLKDAFKMHILRAPLTGRLPDLEIQPKIVPFCAKGTFVMFPCTGCSALTQLVCLAGDLCCFVHPSNENVKCYGEVVEMVGDIVKLKMVRRKQNGEVETFSPLGNEIREVPLRCVLFADGSAEKIDLSFRKTSSPYRKFTSNDMGRKSAWNLVEGLDGCQDYLSTTGILNHIIKPLFIRSVDLKNVPHWPLRCKGTKDCRKEGNEMEGKEDELSACEFDQSHWNIRKHPGIGLGSFFLLFSEQYHCKRHGKWVDAADPSFEHKEGCQASHHLRKCGSYFFDPSATEFIWNSMFKPDSLFCAFFVLFFHACSFSSLS